MEGVAEAKGEGLARPTIRGPWTTREASSAEAKALLKADGIAAFLTTLRAMGAKRSEADQAAGGEAVSKHEQGTSLEQRTHPCFWRPCRRLALAGREESLRRELLLLPPVELLLPPPAAPLLLQPADP